MAEQMRSLESVATERLAELAAADLRRQLRLWDPAQQVVTAPGSAPTQVVNFSSNDYLGLAQDEGLKATMQEAVARYGVGSGASRLVCGNLPSHEELETVLAHFKGTEAALAFSTGYATAVGVIPALMGPGDTVILDKLSHASLIDATKLSGATLRVFPHNHLERLEKLLVTLRREQAQSRILIVTESVFSMDGDAAPLREMVDLKERYGAWLMVDEAHAVGVLGPEGRGLAAALGLTQRIELQMGTLSKALGVSGGYIAGARAVIDLLITRARSLVYSTAPPPAVAATAAQAIRLVMGAEGDLCRARLLHHRQRVWGALATQGQVEPVAGIFPLILGDEATALQASAELLAAGLLIPAIRYPTVARGAARLRLTLSASHELLQIEGLIASLHARLPQFRPAATE